MHGKNEENGLAAVPDMRIERDAAGIWTGSWNGFVLRTAFQPVFRVESGRLTPFACEALLRVSRDDSPVLTDSFLSTLDADAFAMIEPELRRLHIRNAVHLPTAERRLFLNFDPRIPEHPGRFGKVLRELGDELRSVGISPADIVCEITEAETANKAALTHFAYELRARGYMVAVDDFGSHASRPERVRAIAPDIVKFDGRLVRRLLATPSGAATLRLMVSRFREDGMNTVLEGIEALWEIGVAESTGAALLQGYALAAPRLAGPDFGSWLAQFRPQSQPSATPLVKKFR